MKQNVIASFTQQQAKQFDIYFGVPISDYWDLGFDVLKFDEFIAPPDGVSLSEALKTYGASAGFSGENVESFVRSLL